MVEVRQGGKGKPTGNEKGRIKLAIVGSRDFANLELVRRLVSTLSPDEWTIVSGGAIGVDRTAEQVAIERGIPVISIPADWGGKGRAAGVIRNSAIIEVAQIVIAFWDRKSTGTQDSIMKAKAAGLPLTIYYPETLSEDIFTDAMEMVNHDWPNPWPA